MIRIGVKKKEKLKKKPLRNNYIKNVNTNVE